MTDTSAPLLAKFVLFCCREVINEILWARNETWNKIVEACAARHPEYGVGAIPEEERLIVELHRKDELLRMQQIAELCEAIADIDGIRMDVSLSDFQFIKRHYAKLLRKNEIIG